jgi:hypothetical protein
MIKRFVIAAIAFVALIVPSAFAAALLAAPARPAPLPQTGCQRSLADANASRAAMPVRMKHLATLERADACTATRLYFMELVKARAVTAVCKSGPDRERVLGRLDADVERINSAIAASCR